MRYILAAAAVALLLLLGCVGLLRGRLSGRPAAGMVPQPAETASLQSSTDWDSETEGADACADSGQGGSANGIPPPLGVLSPRAGLLPFGTFSITVSLTTTEPANCRWCQKADTLYEDMPYDFQQGQGTTQHSTVVDGIRGLDDLLFYVRCRDSSTGRNPDDYERRTHLRVLGPWDGGYPRIALLYGNYDLAHGVRDWANYDLLIPSWLPDPAAKTGAIRATNPNAKILLTQNATYGYPEVDSLTKEWWDSKPGDPGYNCLLRDSHGSILSVSYWGSPMYNMTVPYCRAVLVRQNVASFLSASPDQGDNLAYDGIFWDRIDGTISWLAKDIDSDLDGRPDDPGTLEAAYRAGVEDLLSRVRACLPNAILMGNEAPQLYAPWINGSLFEWQLSTVLDGSDSLNWESVISDYRDWGDRGQTPHTTFIQTGPEPIYRGKFPFQHPSKYPLAMQAEAAASYQRMRYGLTSALMGDGLFTYDLRTEDGGQWWYDEFGAPLGGQATSLPPRGYLGQPTDEPRLLVDRLNVPDQVANGAFEHGLNSWDGWADTGAGASAAFGIDATNGISGTAAAHIVVTRVAKPWSVLFFQRDKITMAGQSYALSFWARSDVTRTIQAQITKAGSPGTDHVVYARVVVTPQWQRFHLWSEARIAITDGELDFLVGDGVGQLWLDDVQFQAGALGVWARSFENGLAVINATREIQTVPLPGVYCKLKGSQAPLLQVRVDDDEAQVSAGWSEQTANANQFGRTVQVSPAHISATIAYVPALAYSGTYEVLAWVAPTITQSKAAAVTIRHAQGETEVSLDQSAGEVGWHSLGTYTFDVGRGGSVVLAATGDDPVVADALKWVSTARYNDGSQVSQVALQPLDGIVLLSSCSEMREQVCLPPLIR